jgi:hypothetical protein
MKMMHSTSQLGSSASLMCQSRSGSSEEPDAWPSSKASGPGRSAQRVETCSSARNNQTTIAGHTMETAPVFLSVCLAVSSAPCFSALGAACC